MNRPSAQELTLFNPEALSSAGMTIEMIAGGLLYTYEMLDVIDKQLVTTGAFRIANMFELANVSSMVGNLLGSGIANHSNGVFQRSGPHKYPDLIAQQAGAESVEIKVALETNSPKGHLAKPGYYLTCRYVLCDDQGTYTRGKKSRGSVIWIWEVRFGRLTMEHFGVSNSEGDSGKTAVVNAAGMQQLSTIFCDLTRCPYALSGATYKRLKAEHPDTLKLL